MGLTAVTALVLLGLAREGARSWETLTSASHHPPPPLHLCLGGCHSQGMSLSPVNFPITLNPAAFRQQTPPQIPEIPESFR